MRDIESRFREMYETTMPAVYGFVSLRVAGNRALAEDLTAETYTAAVGQFNAGHADDVTISWLRTVAKNRLVDHWRHETVVKQKATILAESNPGDLHANPTRDAVAAALAMLQPDEHTALVLQHLDGYSVAEVAEIIGRSEKATESLLSRARAAFRAAFEEVSHD